MYIYINTRLSIKLRLVSVAKQNKCNANKFDLEYSEIMLQKEMCIALLLLLRIIIYLEWMQFV